MGTIVVVPGIKFQGSGDEMKKQKNEGKYQQFPGRESLYAWRPENQANCYQARQGMSQTHRREDGWTWSMSVHSSYLGLTWSVNVVHRNPCSLGLSAL